MSENAPRPAGSSGSAGSTGSTGSSGSTGRKTAGAFDVRTIIGALLGLYGVILLVMGLVGDTEASKTGDVNANLWAGIVLLIVSAIFFTWWRLRPIVVAEPEEHGDIGARPEH